MAWVPDLPSTPGQYWVKSTLNAPAIVTVSERSFAGSATVRTALVIDGYQLNGNELWEGPIQPPQ